MNATTKMLLVLVSIFSYSFADLNNEGYDAYKKGDFKRAVKLFKAACDEFNALSCLNLGIMYQNGEGVDQSKCESLSYFDQACNHGSGSGCYHLGKFYDEGDGVKKNNFKSLALYNKSCQLKNANGCYAAGMIYYMGQDSEIKTEVIKESVSSVFPILGMAFKGHDAYKNDCKRIETLTSIPLLTGNFNHQIDPDNVKAASFFEKACTLERSDGCYSLGHMTENGFGVSKNLNESKKFYKKACDLGHKNGCVKFSQLSRDE